MYKYTKTTLLQDDEYRLQAFGKLSVKLVRKYVKLKFRLLLFLKNHANFYSYGKSTAGI